METNQNRPSAAEPGESGYRPIGDYAIIGDCRSAALISRLGSLDWFCLPRFDSPSVFAALLDAQRGGRFVVRPSAPTSVSRRYIGETNVLETTFRTATGRLRLTDLVPVASEDEKRRELRPSHQVLRLVECIEGEVETEVVCDPRPNYARVIPRVRDRRLLGFRFEDRTQSLLLRSEIPLVPSPTRKGLAGHERLRAGERRWLSLSFDPDEPAVIPPLGDHAEQSLRQTLRWWEQWSRRCRYRQPYRDDVIRSALVLKLMTYAPSGAVIAAPTTSLPERIGGVRNWDYRYCWLRDASMTLRALFDLGYGEEGESFISWLLHATRLSLPELQILYDVYGETRLEERTLEHLEGFAGSRPVRVGNAASEQLQLDTYGEVLDAAFQFVLRGGRLDRTTGRMLAALGKTVCRRWREPDEGIWEPRGGRRHHTHSKVLCWVALDRLVRLHKMGQARVPLETLCREREAIRHEVEARGFNEQLGSYVSVLDGDEVDASLLLLTIYGYAQPTSLRMRGTVQRIYDELGTGPLLHRYHGADGLPPGEGAFGIAGFWGIECRARQGEVDEASADFERTCALANDVGLFAEEIDPASGIALGNFPQAFTHVGLISAALALAESRGEPVQVPQPAARATA